MRITASVNYHVKCDFPQAFLFEAEGIEGNLESPELNSVKVNVYDIRDSNHNVHFNEDGIVFVHAPSATTDFCGGDGWTESYNREVEALLKKEIGAQEVLVFDHTVRVDDHNAVRKPARNVHNDYSTDGANQRLIDLVGANQAAEYQQGHFAFVNVWRPVEHIITTSPLGFVRPSSIQPDDWMLIELIYPHRKGQILGVAASDQHEWFYQSDMTPDEAIIFNIYDNQGRPHLAHSALDVIDTPLSTVPRKSIETRTLVSFDHK